MPPAVGENIPTAGGLTIYRGITLLFRSFNCCSLDNKFHASIHSICLTTVRSISAFIRIQRLNPIQYISQIILKGTLQLAGTLFFKLLRTVSQFFRPIGQLVNTINNLAASRFQIRSSACQRRSSICQCRSSARQRRCSACQRRSSAVQFRSSACQGRSSVCQCGGSACQLGCSASYLRSTVS